MSPKGKKGKHMGKSGSVPLLSVKAGTATGMSMGMGKLSATQQSSSEFYRTCCRTRCLICTSNMFTDQQCVSSPSHTDRRTRVTLSQ